MRRSLLFFSVLILLLNTVHGQSLVHYWNFNNSATEEALLTPTLTLVPGASIVHNQGANSGGFVSQIQITSNTAQGFDVTNPNARNGDAALTHLRFNNPIGGNLVFSLPSTGYENIVVKYGTRRSGQGAHNQVIDYSVDGTTFTNLTTLQPVDGNPTLQTLDFSAIPAAANNPNFKVRISFTQGGGGLEGNNRFDNFTLEGDPVLSETLIHYWNFNDASTVEKLLTPNVALIPGGSIVPKVEGTTLIDLSATGQNFDVQNLNARNGDPAGTHLRYNFPIPGEIICNLPTTNSKDIIVKYVTRRSDSGAGTQVVEYSTDGGATWIPLRTISITTTPTLHTFDFSEMAAVNNNPNFKMRIRFTAEGGGTVGNNRFDNFTVDGKTSIVDPNPPSVVFVPANNATGVSLTVKPTLTFNKDIRLINNSAITNDNVATLVDFRQNNAEGPLVPFAATIQNRVITLSPNANLLPGTVYYISLKPNVVEGTNDVPIAETQSVTFTTQATSFVSFTNNFLSVSESDGSALVNITLTNPVSGSFRLTLMPAPWSNATAGTDFFFASTTINTNASTPTSLSVVIPVVDDAEAELDEYFVVGLQQLNGYALQGRQYFTVYIRDNDRKAPTPTQEIKLNYVGSYKPGGAGASTAEVSAYDPATKRLFVISAVQNRLDMVNFSNPANPVDIANISLASYGGGVNSVAVRDGLVALAIDNVNPQENGSVVFFNTNGEFIKQVTVGAMPDMITFTPDGKRILTANEGEPNNAYTVDPEGSVSIIDVSGGIASVDQSKVTTVLFTAFNSQEADLIAAGVRKVKKTVSTLSQDLEPEYITFSPDGTKAWVVCQENNAMAELDIATAAFTRIWGLGLKDFNTVTGGGLDASNNSGIVHISNWPVKSYYMPDALATYTVGGKTYIVTANEGDEKEYAGLNERTTIGNNAVVLDPVKFPHAAMLKESFNVGNLRITNLNGDNDGDGDYDDLISVGARSFSIWDAQTGALVWDSKDEIELFTSQHPVYKAVFNADHENNNPKGRSNSKGPEPEGLALANIGGQQYALVTLERIGGLLVYNITDPNMPVLVDYRNERNLNAVGGDRGAETVIYISPEESPDGKAYAVVSNEISGTVTIYELSNTVLPVKLITFNGALRNNKDAELNWTVSGEDELLYFEVERSRNGRDFSKVGRVNPRGKVYEFTDSEIPAGANLYRLKVVEKNGNSYYSQQVVINRGSVPSFVLGLARNPISDKLTVNVFSAKSQKLQATILDMNGRIAGSVQADLVAGSNQVHMEAGKLIPGIYLVQVTTDDGVRETIRFMKQ